MSAENSPEENIVSSEETPDSTERLWAMIAHFCILLPVLPCLLIYWGFKNKSRFIAYHSMQALKFQFYVALIFFVIPGILFAIGVFGNGDGGSDAGLYGYCVFPIFLTALFLGFIAGIEAARGKLYKYLLYSNKWK